MLNLYRYFGMAWYGMTVYMYVLVFNVVMNTISAIAIAINIKTVH